MASGDTKTFLRMVKGLKEVLTPALSKCKDCDSLYIGESGHKQVKRLAEHKSKAASSKLAIGKHIEHSKRQNIDWENIKVSERVPRRFSNENLGSHLH